jgi:hypothetical protein
MVRRIEPMIILQKKRRKKAIKWKENGKENPAIVVFPFESPHKCFQLGTLPQHPSMMMQCITTAPSFDDT